MNILARRPLALAAIAVWLAVPAALFSQIPENPRGYTIIAPAEAAGQELSSQDSLWVLEIQMKPVRMLWTEVTDPVTKQKSRELVWYLVYKAINRPLNRLADTSDSLPINEEDPAPGPPMFIPEFTLVTTDGGTQHAYPDELLPEAQAVISTRERQALRNSVEAIGPLPPETPMEAQADPANVIHGVVTWRGIDPRTDEFTVFLSGFSNGYQIVKGPDGQPLVLRKTLVQDFWRPGDEFDQSEREIRVRGPARWEYIPDDPGAIASVPPEAISPAGDQPAPAGVDEAAPPAAGQP
jgi:hypothetical protein